MKKRKLCILMAIAMMLTILTSCGSKAPGNNSEQAGAASSADPAASLPPASISNEQDEFTKKIVPLDYGPGEQVESLYYRTIIREEDKVVCYEVQPEGEADVLLIPVSDTVIYIVNDADECQVAKTSFDYEVEGSAPIQIVQYRIFATPSTIITGGPADLAGREDGEEEADSSSTEERSGESGDAGSEEPPNEVPGQIIY